MSNEARELIRRIEQALDSIPKRQIYQSTTQEASVLRQIEQICLMTTNVLDDQDEAMAKDLGAYSQSAYPKRNYFEGEIGV